MEWGSAPQAPTQVPRKNCYGPEGALEEQRKEDTSVGSIRWVHTRICRKMQAHVDEPGVWPLYLPVVEGKQPPQHSAPGSPPPWPLAAGLG